MLGLKKTLGATEAAADAVHELADATRGEVSDAFAQLRAGAQIAPAIIVGVGVVALVALILSIVAVSRRD